MPSGGKMMASPGVAGLSPSYGSEGFSVLRFLAGRQHISAKFATFSVQYRSQVEAAGPFAVFLLQIQQDRPGRGAPAFAAAAGRATCSACFSPGDFAMWSLRKKLEIPSPEQCLPGRAIRMPVPERHFVNGHALEGPYPEGLEKAVFGLGCFWGAERKFWEAPGVWTTA
ncbi:MAG TPA: hypothetical protein VHG31_04900, partial [Stellaceae bacterium]|nr:hypothetical protein [Stellaceae bacterium]